MRMCQNHPERKARTLCHACGNYFCPDCLEEGIAYFYCNFPSCRAVREREEIPREVICPECEAEIELTRDERYRRTFTCPACDKSIYMDRPKSRRGTSTREDLDEGETHPGTEFWNRSPVYSHFGEAERRGRSHREILQSVEPGEQERAGVYLSSRIDVDSVATYPARHRTLIIILALFLLLELVGLGVQPGLAGVLRPAALVVVMMLIARQNGWGHNGAIAYSFWMLVSIVLAAFQADISEGLFLLVLFGVPAVLPGMVALRLRKSFFPFLNFRGPVRDGAGRPGILTIIESDSEGQDHSSDPSN